MLRPKVGSEVIFGWRSDRIDNGAGDPHCIRLSAAGRGARSVSGWSRRRAARRATWPAARRASGPPCRVPDRQMRHCRRRRLAQCRIAW